MPVAPLEALSPALEGRYAEATTLAKAASRPAQVGNIALGTAGWTDPSLLKCRAFYPRGANAPEARLRHYSEHFPMVEVDATYYSLLDAGIAARWLKWTSPSFSFNVKAHSSMTGHPIELRRLPRRLRLAAEEAGFAGARAYGAELPSELLEAMWLEFETFVRPLQDGGKLGCLMLQFPPWFEATRGNARHLERLRERWQDFRVSIEFRHRSWLAPERRGRVFDLLKQLRYCYVAVDEPSVPGGGVPPDVQVTNPELSLVRFHGQNTEGWRKGASVAERFNYLYSEAELMPWVARARSLASGSERVHAIFNNCVRDFAVLNAKGLSVLIERPLDVAPPSV
ncbi:MAG: hypothetical protein RJA70_3998 [Pseudomonadota bacterium]|jgi:uncharacterized protein YecE (DUF72 family)